MNGPIVLGMILARDLLPTQLTSYLRLGGQWDFAGEEPLIDGDPKSWRLYVNGVDTATFDLSLVTQLRGSLRVTLGYKLNNFRLTEDT